MIQDNGSATARKSPDMSGGFFVADETCSTQPFNIFLKAQNVITPKMKPETQRIVGAASSKRRGDEDQQLFARNWIGSHKHKVRRPTLNIINLDTLKERAIEDSITPTSPPPLVSRSSDTMNL
ncbi:uncharacterized protein [Musca autumnalis]|uniref:uncharacterized protein n=1 Tax=Musca autumnalis TaxID=221902 RepID=UPI003CF856DC